MNIQKIRLEQIKANTVKYDNFNEQVIGMGIPFYQEFTATEGQDTFTLNTNYNVGSNSLKVFLNGIYQDIGSTQSYVEVDPQTIKFNSQLVGGDWVLVRIEGAGAGTTLEDHIHHTREIPDGSIDGTNQIFTIKYPPRIGSEVVFKNGLLMEEGADADYTIDNMTITFTQPPTIGSRILVNYIS